MKKIVFGLAAVLGVVTSPLSAQWQAMPTIDNNGSPYWDNLSSDGTYCNVGFVLTGVAGTTRAPCNNQRPNPWLPYTGSAPTGYWGTSGGGYSAFLISPGTYNFSLLAGTTNNGGDIAGADLDWGYFTFDGGGNRVRTSMNSTIPGTLTFTGAWGMWINLYAGAGYAYSDLNAQFAAFSTASNALVFGFEDTNLPSSDKDYQDEFIQLAWTDGGGPQETVPEPATMGLLATGLVGMAGAGLRRRRNRK